MTVRIFTIGSLGAAIIGLGLWLLVVTQMNPEQAGSLGLVLFFLSLFIGLAGLGGLLGYGVRRLIWSKQFASYLARTSLRQGIMLAAFFALLLFLQFFRLYRWWLALIVIVLFASLELVFLSYDRSYSRRNKEN